MVKRYLLCGILVLLSFWAFTQEQLQLAIPIIHHSSAILPNDQPLTITMEFNMEGAKIVYTLDGTEPNEQSEKYNGPLTISNPCILTARAIHPGFLSSESVQRQFSKSSIPIAEVKLSREPNEPYRTGGSATLIDGQLGNDNFRSNYLGFNDGVVSITIKTKKRQRVKTITIGMLINQGAWIFAPEAIQLGKGRIERMDPTQTAARKYFYTIPLEPKKRRKIQVRLTPVLQLPKWHPGSGQPGWMFIDEIIVN